MDKRYNYTLVNDVKIPSPDGKNRYIPLDIFPAELLDRLEIYKSLLPNMEGDAVGGVVNMVMKDAPSREEINVNLALGYSQMLFDKNSKPSLLIRLIFVLHMSSTENHIRPITLIFQKTITE